MWWALIVLGIVVLVRWLFAAPVRGGGRSTGRALDVLKERYASGEIERDEFEQKKRDIAA